MSTPLFLAMGGNAGGGAAMKINEDLTQGFTDKSDTFASMDGPLVEGGEFEIGVVEVYGILRCY